MKIISVAFLVQFVLFPLLSVPTIGSAEVIQHDLHSVSMVSEEDALASTHVDATGSDELPRALKKAKGTAKDPKSGKKSKSAKGSASSSPSSPPTSQDSSQPTSQDSSPPTVDPCVVESINTPVDALLALKNGFDNGDENLSDWIDSTDPCTGWTGVFCTEGKVTELICKCNIFCFSIFLPCAKNFANHIKSNKISSLATLFTVSKKNIAGTISPLIGCPTTLVSSLTKIDLSKYITDSYIFSVLPMLVKILIPLTH